jgi:hypothetical protein
LYNIVFGSKTPDAVMNNVVNWTIDHCRDLVKKASATEEPHDVVEESISDAAHAVLMDSDSEDNDDSQKTEDGSDHTSTLKAKPKCMTQWCCLETPHGKITLLVAKRCNAMFIKADAETITAFCELAISFKAQRKQSAGRVHFGGIVPEVFLQSHD